MKTPPSLELPQFGFDDIPAYARAIYERRARPSDSWFEPEACLPGVMLPQVEPATRDDAVERGAFI